MENSEQNTLNYIDFYCERGNEAGFFAEPLNLITNGFFIVLGILALISLKKANKLNYKYSDIILLCLTITIIGFGSGAYHAMPNKKTLLLDVLPIAVFIHLYIPVFFVRLASFKVWQAILILFAFIYAGILAEKTFDPDMLNGTIMYVPTYFMFLLLALVLFLKNNQNYKYVLLTIFIWTFSLIFRTFDAKICHLTYNFGTHFLWHTLNSIVLYRSVKVLFIAKP
jgi:hypothetical protein